MLDAKQALHLTETSSINGIAIKHANIIHDIEMAIRAAASEGETELAGVFINHRIKVEIVKYLRYYGYKVVEQKVGNTFNINWL